MTASRAIPCPTPRLCGVSFHKPGSADALACTTRSTGKASNRATQSIPIAPPLTGSAGSGKIAGKGAEQPKTPRQHQVEAVDALMNELRDPGTRATLSSACGTGKTVSLQELFRRLHDEEDAQLFVVATSTIRLTKQLREAFDNDGILGAHRAFSVHVNSEDLNAGRKESEDSTRTADVEAIRKFLLTPSDEPKVVFTTYDSISKVIEAQDTTEDLSFDAIGFDEAHGLAGLYGQKKQKKGKGKGRAQESEGDEGIECLASDLHDSAEGESNLDFVQLPRVFLDDAPRSLRAKRRAFLTATPVPDPGAPEVASVTSTKSLAALYAREDEGKPAKIALSFHDKDLFGNVAWHMGIPDAVDQGLLATPEPVIARLTIDGKGTENAKVNASGGVVQDDLPGSISIQSWIATAATLEALASGEGRYGLTFTDSVDEAREVEANWRVVANALAGRDRGIPNAQEATAILSDPDSYSQKDIRAARLYMLAQHSSCMASWADAEKSIIDQAYTAFPSTPEDAKCGCGSPGGWCACAKVVANVDLFKEGIDIPAVDTVVINTTSKRSDVRFGQAAGRPLRLWRDAKGNNVKKSGRIVVPVVQDSSGETVNIKTAVGTLDAFTRMLRDSVGHLVPVGKSGRSRHMEGVREHPATARTTVRSVGQIHSESSEDEFLVDVLDSLLPRDRIAAALDWHAYVTAYEATKSEYEDNIEKTPGAIKWNNMTTEQRMEEIRKHANANAPNDDACAVALRLLIEKGSAESVRVTEELIVRRLMCGDKNSLSPDERRVASALPSILDKNGNLSKRIGRTPPLSESRTKWSTFYGAVVQDGLGKKAEAHVAGSRQFCYPDKGGVESPRRPLYVAGTARAKTDRS